MAEIIETINRFTKETVKEKKKFCAYLEKKAINFFPPIKKIPSEWKHIQDITFEEEAGTFISCPAEEKEKKISRSQRGKPQNKLVILPNVKETYVVSDIHGDFDAFKNICIEALRVIKNGGHVIFLGDYVDRGEFSMEVFLGALWLKEKYKDQVTLLRGNHENHFQYHWTHYLDRNFCKVFDFFLEILSEVKLG